MDTQYTEPVSALLTLGRPNLRDEWSKYDELGITQEHVPELLCMIADEKLNWANAEDDTVWAPVYAYRILGNLRAAEAVQPLLERFDLNEEDEWAQEDIPKALAMIGPPAFRPMAHYLADEKNPMYSRAAIAEGLVAMAQQHPELRQDCITRMERQVTHYAKNDPSFNGLIISDLVELKAVEAMPVIQQAFLEECVDVTIRGDLEDVEIDLGLREKRSTPRPRFSLADYFAPEKKKKGGQGKIGRNDPCPCGSGKKIQEMLHG